MHAKHRIHYETFFRKAEAENKGWRILSMARAFYLQQSMRAHASPVFPWSLLVIHVLHTKHEELYNMKEFRLTVRTSHKKKSQFPVFFLAWPVSNGY